MYQKQFDDAIGAPPPAAVDLEALIVRGRRGQRLRVWGAAGGLAVAVLAGTIGVGVLVDSGPAPAGRGNFAAPGAAPSTSKPAWTPKEPVTSPGLARSDPRLTAAEAEALTATLKAALAAAAPDAQITGTSIKSPDIPSMAFQTGAMTDPTAYGDLRDAAGTGGLSVTVEAGNGPGRCSEVAGSGAYRHRVGCVESTGPNGESVLAMTYEDPAGDGLHGAIGGREYEVVVVRPGGGVVTVLAMNVSWERVRQNQGAPPGSPQFEATRTAPPLTLEQAKAIALTPGLRMP